MSHDMGCAVAVDLFPFFGVKGDSFYGIDFFDGLQGAEITGQTVYPNRNGLGFFQASF
jgi:hypothetical protein